LSSSSSHPPTAALAGQAFTHIGYVSENQELPEWMTVQSMTDYLRPFYPTCDAANLLADLDLPDRKLKQLSRGMCMKAALASVLAFRPPLIVMDEPFSGLDPSSALHERRVRDVYPASPKTCWSL
jgi:ABC-2 type transport system ATP-binding protein